MNYWEHPKWAEFVRAVRAEPDETTPAAACADWLGEFAAESSGVAREAAEAREGVIRIYLNGGVASDRFGVAEVIVSVDRKAMLAAAFRHEGGTTPHPMARLSHFELHHGFVRTPGFWPWDLTAPLAARLVEVEPCLRAEVCFVQPHRFDAHGTVPVSWGWRGFGPEEEDGERPSPSRLGLELRGVAEAIQNDWPEDQPTISRAMVSDTIAANVVRELMRGGHDPLRLYYHGHRNHVPRPVWECFPPVGRRSSGGRRHLYANPYSAFSGLFRGAYYALWKLAGVPKPSAAPHPADPVVVRGLLAEMAADPFGDWNRDDGVPAHG